VEAICVDVFLSVEGQTVQIVMILVPHVPLGPTRASMEEFVVYVKYHNHTYTGNNHLLCATVTTIALKENIRNIHNTHINYVYRLKELLFHVLVDKVSQV
jgi:hypothetical protein